MARLSAAIDRNKLVRTIDDVVWSAVRDETLLVALPDGRMLQIGGEIPDFGDEYADPWIYNDVIVTYPDGAMDILTYPKEAFPHLLGSCVGALHDGSVYIFGIVDRKRHPGRSRGPAVLRLDISSYEIAELAVVPPTARVDVYEGSDCRDGNRIVFPIVRNRDSDPQLGIAFDLETFTWSALFPHPHPRAD
jgi:hypothetical protein